jgi:predicted DCC family thiol-disulfide oxidoreductase YuxK
VEQTGRETLTPPALSRHFIYDGACGFCVRSTLLLARSVPAASFVASQDLSDERLSSIGVTRAEARAGAIYVDARRVAHLGAQAFLALVLDAAPGARWFAVLASSSLVRCCLTAIYDAIARNRASISRALRTAHFATHVDRWEEAPRR